METRAPLVLSAFLIVLMLAMAAWAWPELAHHGEIATHFDLAGNPNGFMAPLRAVLIVPAVAAVLTALMAVWPRISRRRGAEAAARSTGYQVGWIGAITVLFVAHCAIILKARGWPIDIAGCGTAMGAFLFLTLGNVLGKTRQNPFVGVRTRWTRQSEYSWDKTNRAAGRMLVGVGLASLAALAAAGSQAARVTLLGGVLAMAAISVALSYYYWRRDPARTAEDR